MSSTPLNKSSANSPVIGSRKNSLVNNSSSSPSRRKASFVERTSAAIEAKFSPSMLRKSSSHSVHSMVSSPQIDKGGNSNNGNSSTEEVQYSMSVSDYEIGNPIGYGSSAVVYIAKYKPLNKNVAIKMIDLDMFERNQIDELRREIQIMNLCRHPNLLTFYGSFVNGSKLYIVTPYLSAGSCLNLMKYAYPDGFEELVIATILKQALQGLDYLHKSKLIHRDVKAGNLLIDEDGVVRLGDFGVSSSLMETGERKGLRKTFVGTPCWMAPEVMEQSGYNYKADIWSFGITALELATGHAPFAKYPPIKVLMLTLQNEPPTLDRDQASHKFSKTFKEMIDSCLVKDPTKRPTSEKLLQHPFFKQAKKPSYLVSTILNNVPPLTQIVHIKKELPQPKVSHEKGISWDFDNDTNDDNVIPKGDNTTNSVESVSEISNVSSKQASPENSTEQLSLKMVKFNEEQNNNTTNTATTTLPKKGRFILDSDNINTPTSVINSANGGETTPGTATTQNTEIKKGRFSLLETISTDSRSNSEVIEGEKKGRFEIQTSPTMSSNDIIKHSNRFTCEVNSAQLPVGNGDSQKQINERLDLVLKQSERQFYMLNELMSTLSIKQGLHSKNSQDNVRTKENISVFDTVNTLNDQIQSLMNENEELQKENESMRNELENKAKVNEQLLAEIEALKKKK